jgi:hypothetical protein
LSLGSKWNAIMRRYELSYLLANPQKYLVIIPLLVAPSTECIYCFDYNC